MKRILPIIIIILLLCCLTTQQNKAGSKATLISNKKETESKLVQTEIEQEYTDNSQSKIAPKQEPIEGSGLILEPKGEVLNNSVEIPVEVSDYKQFLTSLNIKNNPDFVTEMETPIEELISSEDDAYYVEFDPNLSSNLQLDRAHMPTYTWYINGNDEEKIKEVVIEFDLLETIHSLHPSYFGYDKGFFITLHHFQDIPLFPPWIEENDRNSHYTGGADRREMIMIPEFGEDLRRYANQDENHIKITIPYSEFQSTAKDLTLQFLPGTTFANLNISLWGTNELNSNIINNISKPVIPPERDLLHDVIMPAFQKPEHEIISIHSADNVNVMNSFLFKHPVMGSGLMINNDGSINMPVSLYNLEEYKKDVKGKYALIPEGLVSVFTTLSSYSYLGYINNNKEQRNKNERMIVDFVFEKIVDETGQFYGIYDIEQEKIVASNRKSSALPILSALLINSGREDWGTEELTTLADDEIDFIVNSIIANDIVCVGNKLYYAPHGVKSDGLMKLSLSDFAVSNELFYLLTEYSGGSNRLDEEFGCAMLLEGFANSLKLILEGQKQNVTRLPSTKLEVVFSNDGKTYELFPSETFNINDSFFSLGLTSYNDFELFYQEFEYVGNEGVSANRLSEGENGVYSEDKKQIIRETEAKYAEYYNYFSIVNTLYNSWLNIYNFLQMQPSQTAYAPKYDVNTSEMIMAPTDALYPEFHMMSPFINRFGTPATSMNYHLLVGMFNNETMIKETAHLALVNFEMWESERMFRSKKFDYSNPDFFADNGFNIWGYDSLYYVMSGSNPATKMTRYLYNTSGTNMARENWREYTMRKLNEHIHNAENQIMIDDDFPTFYDHLPEIEISN